MLKVNDLRISYGHVKAVKGISFEVKESEIVSILGGNGAGKTSTMYGILNIVKSSGKVEYKEEDISDLPTQKIVKKGMVLSPENRRIFSDLTVEENLKMGSFTRGNPSEKIKEVYELFPRLKERKRQDGGSLSGGEQQMLAIGRALMGDPELLLLDEPSLGLAPIIIENIFNVLETLRKEGVSILLVEQNAQASLEISDRSYILETGVIVHQGNSKELLKDEKIKSAYLGI